MDCLFCNIASGAIPSYHVYEDDRALAFLDIHPLAKGHTLVIPKMHGGTILDLPEDEVAHLFRAVQKTTARVKEIIKPDGFTLGVNHEIGQDVPHLHVHIIPRWHGDSGVNIHDVVRAGSDVSVEEVAKLFG
ncbi:hypothetical protein A3H75_00640 [Candidatus Uhrbacteria bacterium RIFCSPLOWO2_02_FULL_51_9]|uniref:HIT domain-containing protein n=1 Tax=Candidatus Uhrbacteria bacterium RIFCSPLOWO2_02_FULL_51_9 TaxID=1802410 RepID=A0A1F7VDM1_9BACT|nr:MAG: hypothetical protein A3H75_00640 [Candidatus Uhrbacteria bacterium RIFCSPLOWO2_02_FULL_51_9]